MKSFTLQQDFTDQKAEQELLSAISKDPGLYWRVKDLITDDAFYFELNTWQSISKAIESEQPLDLPSEWAPAIDPVITANTLAGLGQRRRLASLQEYFGVALFSGRPSREIANELVEEAAKIAGSMKDAGPGVILWGDSLLLEVLQDATERYQQCQATGRPVMGLTTGLRQFDTKLNGLNTGLYLLGGGPSVGKTTLAMQIGANVVNVENTPVIYVSFENSPANLVRKIICARANTNLLHVLRGQADLPKLNDGAAQVKDMLQRFALIEGTSSLKVSDVRAAARQVMNHCRAERCLIIVDYLQLWAKASRELRELTTVRERVEVLGAELRELAIALRSPVLALSSQNRDKGDYGKNQNNGSNSKKGNNGNVSSSGAGLDSLKESGDLEYAADCVLFIVVSERSATPPARSVDLWIGKNRDAELGKVELVFRPDIATFREFDTTHADPF
ncbi:MAG: DnaB-like helicase C-terminal domain-containing protein [Bacteroidota bacterium]